MQRRIQQNANLAVPDGLGAPSCGARRGGPNKTPPEKPLRGRPRESAEPPSLQRGPNGSRGETGVEPGNFRRSASWTGHTVQVSVLNRPNGSEAEQPVVGSDQRQPNDLSRGRQKPVGRVAMG